MVKEQKIIGLSPDLIIHPGETLAEILEDREMSQKELAIRTGMTEKHISTVVKGQKNISVAFAKKLEYALGIDASFWINLQANYDKELLEFEEVNNITEAELNILKPLKQVTEYLVTRRWINENTNEAEKVLCLRKILAVSNLTAIPHITYNAAYRAQVATNINVDTYVLYAWQRICELMTKDIVVSDELNVSLLRDSISEIKKLMFEDINIVQGKLENIFSKCGIAFKIVKHFKGAPVQGFIKKTDDEKLILCMTIRQNRADIFWFTLFHEIGHIINEDIKQRFIDFNSTQSDMEARADTFARDVLMNARDYKEFVMQRDFSLSAINAFAKEQGVRSYIVIGRLQSDEILSWDQYNEKIVYYKWAE